MEVLYTYEEVLDLVAQKGLAVNPRKDAKSNKLCQFVKKGSSLHVRTSRDKMYRLVANDIDFINIKNQAEVQNIKLLYMSSESASDITDIIELCKNKLKDSLLCIKNGNRIMYPNQAENYVPHLVYAFCNENIDIVLNALTQNDNNMQH